MLRSRSQTALTLVKRRRVALPGDIISEAILLHRVPSSMNLKSRTQWHNSSIFPGLISDVVLSNACEALRQHFCQGHNEVVDVNCSFTLQNFHLSANTHHTPNTTQPHFLLFCSTVCIAEEVPISSIKIDLPFLLRVEQTTPFQAVKSLCSSSRALAIDLTTPAVAERFVSCPYFNLVH